MGKNSSILRGSIRQKVFSMLLITVILIIAAYTAIFLYQTKAVEQMVTDLLWRQGWCPRSPSRSASPTR